MATVENATDNRTLETFPSEDDNVAESENCDCDFLNGFSCWPRVRTGTEGTTELTCFTFHPWYYSEFLIELILNLSYI